MKMMFIGLGLIGGSMALALQGYPQAEIYAVERDEWTRFEALGRGAKRLREERGLDRKDDLREHLTADELAKVSRIERVVSSLLEAGFDYDGVKAVLDEYQNQPALSA